ncbi:MAG: hypothetical protein LLG14_01725 [Nocardiaceae bacterium]|nr:hypothetical protein [Nocardiaceae bacterium]
MRSQPIVEPGLPGLVKAGALAQANVVGTVLRNLVFVLSTFVYLGQPFHTPLGALLAALTFWWGAFRLITLKLSDGWVIADAVIAVVLCVCEVFLVGADNPDVSSSFTRSIAEAVVVAVAVSMPVRISVPTIVATILACVAGHWIIHTDHIDWTPLYFLVDGGVAAAVRWAFVRAAASADTIAEAVRAERLHSEVASARRRFERDQMALLHDTAASTLLMIGDGVVPDRDRLADQAARDVRLLESASLEISDYGLVDLTGGLEQVCRESHCVPSIRAGGPVLVTRAVRSAVCGATREALNNAARHSRAGSVEVTLRDRSVTITDDGRGFAVDGRAGYGIRASIEGRMRRAGGTADIDSAPGHGTRVSLTWQDHEVRQYDDSPIDPSRVLRGYGYGLSVGAVIATLELAPRVLTGPVPYLWAQLCLIALCAGAGIVAALTIARRIGRLGDLYAALLFVLSPIALLLLPADGLIGGQNWAMGPAGWGLLALLVAAGQPRTVLALSAIVSTWCIDAAIVLVRANDPYEFANVGYLVVCVGMMHVFAIVFARILRLSVIHARELDAERTRLQTEQAIAAALQADYRERFSNLARTVIPVLKLLADRSISSDDPEVQELARAESARLRRLFAQSDAFDHPLVQHLRRGLDEAERRGVAVGFDLDNRPPDLPVDESGQTVSALNDLIDGASSRVRLVMTSSPSEVTVSVVSDCESELLDSVRDKLDGSRYELTTAGSVAWVRVYFPVPVSA